jgi:hypothetical protein
MAEATKKKGGGGKKIGRNRAIGLRYRSLFNACLNNKSKKITRKANTLNKNGHRIHSIATLELMFPGYKFTQTTQDKVVISRVR